MKGRPAAEWAIGVYCVQFKGTCQALSELLEEQGERRALALRVSFRDKHSHGGLTPSARPTDMDSRRHFADLVANEANHLQAGGLEQLADRLGVVLDERLLDQDVVGEPRPDFALDDLLQNLR